MLIVPYEWILENVEKDSKTIASNVILFRGERVLRVALKVSNSGNQSTLIFLAIDLNKIGLRIADLVCGKEGVNTLSMMDEKKPIRKQEEIHSKEGHLQLFTCKVDVVIGEKCTFVFQIHFEGIVAGYSYCSFDPTAKDQLWSTVNNKLHADVEFIVQDKRFSAHKAILAARSSIFQAEFAREETNQIRIEDVDATSFEQFLHFVYTGEFLQFAYNGEPMTSLLANENLLKLAERYQLKTLEDLCRVALLEVSGEQMVSFVANVRNNDGQETCFKIR